MRQPGQDLYGLAVWLHNSPIVPPDPGLFACLCSPGMALPGVHLSHRRPQQEGAGLGTHSPRSLREQAFPLKAERGHPKLGWGFWSGRGTGPSWERDGGSAGAQGPGSPPRGGEAPFQPHSWCGDGRQLPKEDTGHFSVDVLRSSRTRGSVQPHLSWAEKVCV